MRSVVSGASKTIRTAGRELHEGNVPSVPRPRLPPLKATIRAFKINHRSTDVMRITYLQKHNH
jgi:hypothetical protein